MKVELRIDPGCDGMSVVINAPALTDEVKALAARLEGGGVLVGWQGGRAVPLAAEDILRCYGEEKGVKCQTPGGVYDLKERLYELEGRLDRHTFVRISHSEIISLRKITTEALALNATVVVLAHNHPSGLATPSQEDLFLTRYIQDSLKPLGITLYDHVILTDDDMVSLRDSRYLTPL